ncbi:MAG: hypothetical protein U9R25_18230 [Chloroflexota bacterium]|nr:hypothetical protein [Chloroflexota bacterium]
MADKNEKTERTIFHSRALLFWVVAATLIVGSLAALPVAWALPDQAPDFQTVPTRTPTPTSPGSGPTPTDPPSGPTDTPVVPTSTPVQPTRTPTPVRPTDTPVPGQPTSTLTPVRPTDTPVPGQPTSTPGPVEPTATLPAAVTPVVPPVPVPLFVPEDCLTWPTPGFIPEQLPTLMFEGSSDFFMAVPGQNVQLSLNLKNLGSSPVHDVVVCNPLDSALELVDASVTQGTTRVMPGGVIAELGTVPPRGTAEIQLMLTIRGEQPLGTVIENQAWVAADDQRASTWLWTWALPPAWLPPTGN